MDPPEGGEATVLKAVQSVGAVVGPTALLTALLFYFGWARASSQASYLGLDVTLFGFSTEDYLLQSISSVYVPLAEVLLVALLVLWAHRVVSRWLDRHSGLWVWPFVEGALVGVGTASFVVGVVLYNDETPTNAVLLWTPLCLVAGLGLVSYAVLVDRRRRGENTTGTTAGSGGRTLPTLSVIILSMLLGAGLVWEVANYADVKGRQLGRFAVEQLAYRPGVMVYSEKRLHIDSALGVTETALGQPDSAYGFRYEGLKLLLRSGSRYFLVTSSWPAHRRTLVLPESDSVRLEFVRSY